MSSARVSAPTLAAGQHVVLHNVHLDRVPATVETTDAATVTVVLAVADDRATLRMRAAVRRCRRGAARAGEDRARDRRWGGHVGGRADGRGVASDGDQVARSVCPRAGSPAGSDHSHAVAGPRRSMSRRSAATLEPPPAVLGVTHWSSGGRPAAVAGGAVVSPTADPPGRLLLLAFPAALERPPGPRPESCSTSNSRCCARSAPSCSSSAASGSSPSASTTSCSTARTRRWTTACASPRRAASACSSRPSAPARSRWREASSPTTDAARGACASSTSACRIPAVGPGGRLMQPSPRRCSSARGVSVVSYYRAFLPAVALGADYAPGSATTRPRDPPGDRPRRSPAEARGAVRLRGRRHPAAARRAWLKLIRELQDAGVTVLYEIDDYVQSARKIKSHELSDNFDAEFVAPDGDGDARRRRDRLLDRLPRAPLPLVQRRTWACYNGIDLNRYAIEQPDREGVTIGWAGGVGHKASLARWEPALRAVAARARSEARFVSVGLRRGRDYVEEFGPERAIAVPAREDRGLPGVDDAVRHRDRAVGGEQPVPRQERPALARGERARHPAGRAPRRLSRRSRTA